MDPRFTPITAENIEDMLPDGTVLLPLSNVRDEVLLEKFGEGYVDMDLTGKFMEVSPNSNLKSIAKII